MDEARHGTSESTELRLAIMRLSRLLRLETAATDLSASRYAVLRWVVTSAPISPGRLAELERVTPPSMNRTVNCLVEEGLVTREDDPADGRKVLVRPTDRGIAVVADTQRRRDAWLAGRYATLTDEEQAVLARATEILGKLADA
ncbi:MarR family winged helix-turn-helix transcriptional regulator [Agromyces sp. MMS24-JH15]|uniref:MarR family winged helix-turn-helix transcriptional regulator n=1 Tax=Agromyces sp. MMS24-JH15 TaxID=3243765 RepID=UPI003749E3AC